MAEKFRRRGLQVEREPKISPSAGLRKPDLVITHDGVKKVLDVQVVGAYSTLEEASRRKEAYYNTPEMASALGPSSTHAITIGYRGFLAASSFSTLRTSK